MVIYKLRSQQDPILRQCDISIVKRGFPEGEEATQSQVRRKNGCVKSQMRFWQSIPVC